MSCRKSRAAAATVALPSRNHQPQHQHHDQHPGQGGGSSHDTRAGVEIHIANHYAARIYTSGEPISGEALVRVSRDTHYDRIAVQLAGLASTRNYMTPEVDHVVHHFLLLDMPALDKSHLLPSDRMLRAGRTYALPFHFVVPHGLPIGACRQHCEHASVREHHLRLPPSIGGRCWGGLDDDSPETARVEYCITVSVLQRSASSSSEPASVLQCRQEINVLPAYTEDAPLDVTRGDKRSEYRLTKSKPLRKSLLSRKLGMVAVEATQPAAVRLASNARETSWSHVPVHLTFSPASSSASDNMATLSESDSPPPPVIHSVSAKLVTKTYYNTAHIGSFPDRGLRHELNYGTPLFYSHTSPLFDALFASPVGWQLESHPDKPVAWANKLRVAFKLPVDHSKKMLLPTFHSCLLSRIYTLRLIVTLGPGHTNVALSLPLQVAVDEPSPVVREAQLDSPTQQPGLMRCTLPKYKQHIFPYTSRQGDEFNVYMTT